MEENVYRMKGWFEKNGNKMNFTKEMISNSEERAKEKLYSILGSKHAAKRNMIEIEKTEEIKPEEAENPDIREIAGGD